MCEYMGHGGGMGFKCNNTSQYSLVDALCISPLHFHTFGNNGSFRMKMSVFTVFRNNVKINVPLSPQD